MCLPLLIFRVLSYAHSFKSWVRNRAFVCSLHCRLRGDSLVHRPRGSMRGHLGRVYSSARWASGRSHVCDETASVYGHAWRRLRNRVDGAMCGLSLCESVCLVLPTHCRRPIFVWSPWICLAKSYKVHRPAQPATRATRVGTDDCVDDSMMRRSTMATPELCHWRLNGEEPSIANTSRYDSRMTTP
jgi:hypothetical protein